MQVLTSPHCSQNQRGGWGGGCYLGRLNCIPHGKMSQTCQWALGAPKPPFSPPRPGGSQQQRVAAAGTLAPLAPQHPRPGAGSGRPAHVRAEPRRGRAPPPPPPLPGGTLVSGHHGHHHLHPSPVAGLIFERKDGNLNSSSLAPLCRGGLRATSLRSAPSAPSHLPALMGTGWGPLLPPAISYPRAPLLQHAEQMGRGHPTKGVLGRGRRGMMGVGCPGVRVKDECWHWRTRCMSR